MFQSLRFYFVQFHLLGYLCLNIKWWVYSTVRATVFVPPCWISSFRTPWGGRRISLLLLLLYLKPKHVRIITNSNCTVLISRRRGAGLYATFLVLFGPTSDTPREGSKNTLFWTTVDLADNNQLIKLIRI